MTPVHRTFAVGRLAKQERHVIILARVALPPIRGPWELRAVISR